ncbi:uncharacterized protein B0I36DRAFT_294963 [Microdochium trichocladiopsis]|uniref:Phosphotransferase n=1 Tax=Microdochium trichocladiopsis TaxID=1682393 RepID=A0A9P8XX05_9PEZI|nr:uncharacterized protein B0I36DRAFT_294963 [Microdochium trichocladiopsis]KAH7024362.1 hypothetical protein B0I36DRAFT_294963 [Microdochium trichocladiopsis]
MTNPVPRWDASDSPAAAAAAELIEAQFDLSPDTINHITRQLGARLRLGLQSQQPFQLPAFVTSVPNGSEKGTFLAIDLGGTNCRICSVTLNGDGTFAVTQNKAAVALDLRVNASYKPLFAFIAAKLADFLAAELGPGKQESGETSSVPYRLGFTFSFTCDQTSVAQGTLIHWDKGWDIPEAIGKDPCVLLQEAIDAIKLPVRVCVLANDSVGTLLTRSYISRSSAPTLAGVIFGTGTNAAYVERLHNVTRLPKEDRPHPARESEDIMVINTEWGCLDDGMGIVPSTEFDDMLDRESADQGGQMLEKRVSGMYLGELLRLVIASLMDKGALTMVLVDDSSMLRRYCIDSSFLSALAEHEGAGDVCKTRDLISKVVGADSVSEADAMIISRAARAIAQRAARLAGAALAAVIIQSGRLGAGQGKEADQKVVVKQKTAAAVGRTTIMGILDDFCGALSLFTRKVLHAFGISRWRSRAPAAILSETAAGEIIDIGVDGSLIEFYPGFEDEMRVALRQVTEIGLAGEQRVRIGMAKDGSGVGAALMALAATKTE